MTIKFASQWPMRLYLYLSRARWPLLGDADGVASYALFFGARVHDTCSVWRGPLRARGAGRCRAACVTRAL
eukprot:4641512-Prymnesium_polylepis.1